MAYGMPPDNGASATAPPVSVCGGVSVDVMDGDGVLMRGSVPVSMSSAFAPSGPGCCCPPIVPPRSPQPRHHVQLRRFRLQLVRRHLRSAKTDHSDCYPAPVHVNESASTRPSLLRTWNCTPQPQRSSPSMCLTVKVQIDTGSPFTD